MPGGYSTTSPEQGVEVCKVQGPHCQQIPSQRIYCKTEGQSILICTIDLKQWRDRVASTESERHRLQLRCPNCADWASSTPSRSPILPKQEVPILRGPVAVTLDKAMHAEGLLVDQRQRVLQRLQSDAPWLASSFIEPGFISTLEGAGCGVTAPNTHVHRVDLHG